MSNNLHRNLSSANSSKFICYTPKARLKDQMDFIDDFGLISSDLKTFKPYYGRHTTRNVNTIKLAEFWGENSAKKMIVNRQLTKAAQSLKYEYWKGTIKGQNIAKSQKLPHKLDNFVTSANKNYDKMHSNVLSPNNHLNTGKEKIRTGRLGIINDIIQSCIDCGSDGIRVKKEFVIKMKEKKKLTKSEKMNIENNIRVLDYQ